MTKEEAESLIYAYIEQKLKPSGWAYMTKEEGYRNYIPFLALFGYLYADGNFLGIPRSVLGEIVDTPHEGIFFDVINGGIQSTKPCFSASINEDYPHTKYSLYVDFRQHFSMHSFFLNKLPKDGIKQLKEYVRLNKHLMPIHFASFTLAGDIDKLRWAKRPPSKYPKKKKAVV